LVKLLDEFTDLFAKATSSGKTLTSRHKFFGKTKDDLISAKYAVLRAILPFSDAFPTNQRHNNDDLYDDWKEITNNFMNSAGTWSEKDNRDASKKYNKYLLDGLKQTTTWSIEYIEDYAKKKEAALESTEQNLREAIKNGIKTINEAHEGDPKKYKIWWDKGPETQIRRKFGKEYNTAIDNRMKLLLTLVDNTDKAEDYAEMDFLTLPDDIATQLVNMDPKELHALLDESVIEGKALAKLMAMIDDNVDDEDILKEFPKLSSEDLLDWQDSYGINDNIVDKISDKIIGEGKITESVIGVKTEKFFRPDVLTKALDKAKIKYKFNRLSLTLSVIDLDKKYFEDAKQVVDDLGLSVMMAKESKLTEGMSKGAIKKAIKTIDKQIDTETGGDGEPLDNETLQALEQERERLESMLEGKLTEAYIELDAIDPKNKVLLKQLKGLKVKMKVISKSGPGGGAAVIGLTGKREALEDVVSNPVWGWDDPELAEFIEEGYNMKYKTPKVKGKKVAADTIEIDGVEPREGPDDGTTDAYASYAEFTNGKKLSQDELDDLTDNNPDLIYRLAMEQFFESKVNEHVSQINKTRKNYKISNK
jgi:hypothetical protein